MVANARERGAVCLGVLALAFTTPRPEAHPIHTTFTEIVQVASPGIVSVTVRGFADDLTAASRLATLHGNPDSAIVQYLLQRVTLTDRGGGKVRLSIKGSRRTSDVLWFTFETSYPTDLGGCRFSNAALTELHEDQVNLVQIKAGGKTRTLLFTPGDRAKLIGE